MRKKKIIKDLLGKNQKNLENKYFKYIIYEICLCDLSIRFDIFAILL